MHNGIAGLAQQEICIGLHLAQLPGGLFNPSNQLKKLSQSISLHFSFGMGNY